MSRSAAAALVLIAGANAITVTKNWVFQDGTNMFDKINDAAVDSTRGVAYLVGTTYGDYGTRNYANDDIQDYYTEFVAVRLDYNTGKKVWTFQDQGGKDEQFVGAMIDKGSGDLIAAGVTQSMYGCPSGGCTWMTTPKTVIFKDDFTAVRIGLNTGKTTWKWQYGTSGDETTTAASVSPTTGEIVIVGSTVGSYGLQRPDPNVLVREHPYDTDFAATKITNSGVRTAVYQTGTSRGERFTTVAHGNDGSVFMAGETFGSYAATNAGDRDLVVVKQDASGAVKWKHQSGTASEDYINGVAVDAKGDVYVAGYLVNAQGNEDFWLKKLSGSTGAQVWNWTQGSSGTNTDILTSVTVGSDGTIVAAGYTSGSYSGANKGGYDAVVIGFSAAGAKLWAWQDGSDKSERINSISAGAGQTYLLAGESYGSYGATNKGDWDFVALKITAK